MIDEEKAPRARVAFFADQFMNDRESSGFTPVVDDVLHVEAFLWLQLGVAIHYFEKEDALKVLHRFSETLAIASSNLRRARVTSADDDWCRFAVVGSDGRTTIDSERFLAVR